RAGVGVGGEVRLLVSRSVLSLAARPARHAVVGSGAGEFRQLSAESRSGGQLRARGARASAHESRPLARDDGVAPADAVDADALSGAGIRRVGAVPVFRRPRSGAGGGSTARTR